MAFCSSCGERTRWARKESGSWHPPLSEAGMAYVVDSENVVRKVPVYVRHVCNPERVEAFQDEAVRRHALRQESEAACELAWKDALTRPCPKCGRGVNERCMNLRDSSKDTVWPHTPRRMS